MIQLKRKLYGLDKLYYDYIDTDSRSRNIFRLLDFPETFNLGKNQFKILANNEVLLKNSKIYIDIVDSNGNAVFYEISHIANRDNSRSIIVYIYPNTSAGNCTVNIAGRLYIDPVTKEPIYFNDNIRDEPNVLWMGVVNVSPYQESESRIKFLTDPVVEYKERIEQLQVISGSTRLSNLYAQASDSIRMSSIVEPKQLNPSSIDVERTDIKKIIAAQPRIVDGRGTNESISLPYFSGLSTIQSTNFKFSSSMEGGVIYVNGIDVDYPAEAVVSSSFFGLSYSASIVNVVSDNLIEVSPSFQRSLSYRVADGSTRLFSVSSFSNQTNFTASFYDVYDLSSSLTTQSFLEVNAYGISPVAGIVDSINVSYKSINSFGDFQSLGDFKVNNKNLLVDSGSLKFSPINGIVENPIGYFPNGVLSFEENWISGSVGNLSIVVYDSSIVDIKISDGVALKHSSGSLDEFMYVMPDDQHSVYAYGGSEFELSFSSFLEIGDIDLKRAQIDVYISGSNNVISDIVTDSLLYAPLKTTLGTYVGSVSSNNGALRNTVIPFIVRDSCNIRPVFVLRTGFWHFGKVELKAMKSIGFSPNQTKIFVPLESVQKESELIFKIEYKDRVGIRADVDTKLYGLYFSGSSPIEFSDIQNVPSDLGANTMLNHLQSYRKVYITQSSANVNNGGGIVQVTFPIFRDEDNDVVYTGSLHNVGLAYQIDTVIFARTGSTLEPFDAYTWAGSVQGRCLVSAVDNSGKPLLYAEVALSGSNTYGLGTFGTGPTLSSFKSSLDSWFSLNSINLGGSSDDNIIVRYNLTPTSSFFWNATAASVCTVWKYETR